MNSQFLLEKLETSQEFKEFKEKIKMLTFVLLSF